MPAWSYLLRILLSLALVLNGATPAMAAAQMDAAAHRVQEDVASQRATHEHVAHERAYGDAVHTHAAAPSMSTHAMPCHHDAGTLPSRPADAAPAHDGATAGKGKHPSPDCCKTGTCHCVCVQTMQLLTVAWTAPASLLSQADPLRPVARGHDEPALPHLIRPPIG